MMAATRETLRSWFYRPWFLATIAAVLSASLLIAGSMFAAMRQMELRESQEMNAQGERFLARLEQLFGQLRESLDDLEAQPLRGCDEEMIATLQQVTFNYRFVYEAAYMDASRFCSNRPRQEGLSVLLVEQNAIAALEVVSHGYLLENGRIVMHDSAEAMKKNPDIQEFYLGGSEGKNFHDIKHYSRRKRWLS